MSFEKPGRPAKNAAEERLRIYAAALPEIRENGARAHMSALAASAHMSVGGLYHYFDTKQSLLLHGLNPEALALACHTFHKAMRAAADDGAAEVTSIYLDKTMYMFRLIQPAAMVAVEMGIDEIRTQLGAALQEDADGLIDVLATTTPQLPAETRHDLAAAIRRTLLALSLDPNATENDVRIQLTAVISGFVAVGEPTPA